MDDSSKYLIDNLFSYQEAEMKDKKLDDLYNIVINEDDIEEYEDEKKKYGFGKFNYNEAKIKVDNFYSEEKNNIYNCIDIDAYNLESYVLSDIHTDIFRFLTLLLKFELITGITEYELKQISDKYYKRVEIDLDKYRDDDGWSIEFNKENNIFYKSKIINGKEFNLYYKKEGDKNYLINDISENYVLEKKNYKKDDVDTFNNFFNKIKWNNKQKNVMLIICGDFLDGLREQIFNNNYHFINNEIFLIALIHNLRVYARNYNSYIFCTFGNHDISSLLLMKNDDSFFYKDYFDEYSQQNYLLSNKIDKICIVDEDKKEQDILDNLIIRNHYLSLFFRYGYHWFLRINNIIFSHAQFKYSFIKLLVNNSFIFKKIKKFNNELFNMYSKKNISFNNCYDYIEKNKTFNLLQKHIFNILFYRDIHLQCSKFYNDIESDEIKKPYFIVLGHCPTSGSGFINYFKYEGENKTYISKQPLFEEDCAKSKILLSCANNEADEIVENEDLKNRFKKPDVIAVDTALSYCMCEKDKERYEVLHINFPEKNFFDTEKTKQNIIINDNINNDIIVVRKVVRKNEENLWTDIQDLNLDEDD